MFAVVLNGTRLFIWLNAVCPGANTPGQTTHYYPLAETCSCPVPKWQKQSFVPIVANQLTSGHSTRPRFC